MAEGDGADFGAVLRRYRLTTRLTQEEPAEQAHLSVRAITDLERACGARLAQIPSRYRLKLWSSPRQTVSPARLPRGSIASSLPRR